MIIYLDSSENPHKSKFHEIEFKKVDNDFESFCDNLKISGEDVILINSEMLLSNVSKHTDLDGVLLLKWLRIYKRCTNRIIISGFLPLQRIIESNPEHVILLARGTTYLQYPFTEMELDEVIKITPQIEKDKLVSFYRPFIKADFNIEQIGHSFANEFGLFLMQSIHEYIGSVRIECNYSMKDSALNFEKAKFLYFSNIDKHTLTVAQDELIEKLLALTVDDPLETKKILYIDDQADLGWNKLFAGIIYNDPENSNFITIPKIDVLNEREISRYINRDKPSCVLLDLRMKGKDEENISIEEISGYKILKFIKNKYPSLPVIITSATNKAESLSALLQAGAEGLWTKPRVESINRTSQLYDSYFNILRLVYNALTKFKTILEKTIFELDFHVNQISTNFSHAELENSLFIFDTNYFICNENEYVKFQNRIKGVITLHNSLAERNLKQRIIILDDVLSELNRLSTGAIKLKSEDLSDIKYSAKYSKYLLMNLLDSGSGVLHYDYVLERNLKDEHITYNIVEDKKVMLYKQQNELIEKFQYYQDAIDEREKLISLNKKTILHADDTLKFIVSNKFLNVSNYKEISNIYFISSDFGCNYNVYRYITNQNFKFFNINHKHPVIWDLHERKNLKQAGIFFKHHKTEKRNLFILESSNFLKVFDHFKDSCKNE